MTQPVPTVWLVLDGTSVEPIAVCADAEAAERFIDQALEDEPAGPPEMYYAVAYEVKP